MKNGEFRSEKKFFSLSKKFFQIIKKNFLQLSPKFCTDDAICVVFRDESADFGAGFRSDIF